MSIKKELTVEQLKKDLPELQKLFQCDFEVIEQKGNASPILTVKSVNYREYSKHFISSCETSLELVIKVWGSFRHRHGFIQGVEKGEKEKAEEIKKCLYIFEDIDF